VIIESDFTEFLPLLYTDPAVDQVDAQLQQLRTTQNYLYWRERSQRKIVESTNSRVLWFAILRASGLVLASVVQVLGVRHMFSKK